MYSHVCMANINPWLLYFRTAHCITKFFYIRLMSSPPPSPPPPPPPQEVDPPSLTIATNVASSTSSALLTTSQPPLSPQQLAVKQLKSVLAQLTAVTESQDHVAALEARCAEYESMIGAASIAQRKFQKTIANLEKQLQEANMNKKQLSSNSSSSASSSSSSSSSTVNLIGGTVGNVVAPISSSSPSGDSSVHSHAAQLASQFGYPASFESNLAQFLSDHVQVGDMSDENDEWHWQSFPPSSSSSSSAVGPPSTSDPDHRPSTLPSSAADKLLKLDLAPKPIRLYQCTRLGIGLETPFQQLHQLIYLHTVATMQNQLP